MKIVTLTGSFLFLLAACGEHAGSDGSSGSNESAMLDEKSDTGGAAQPAAAAPFVTRSDVLTIFASDGGDGKRQDCDGKPKTIALQGTKYEIIDFKLHSFGLIGKTLTEALDEMGLTEGSNNKLTLIPTAGEDNAFYWKVDASFEFFTLSIMLKK